ncbi:MAG: peptidylprolyl isomerase [Nodosilinea sp.]
MTTQPFLYVDEEPITCDQVLAYLEASGQLATFLEEVLSQHAITKEFEQNSELLASEESPEILLSKFRQRQNMTDDAVFAAWLDHNDLEAEELDPGLRQQHAMQQLIQAVSAPGLTDYFNAHQDELAQVYLSSIVVRDEVQAQELYDQITDSLARFEDLAQAHSLADSHTLGGALPPIAKADLPAEISEAIAAAEPGQVIGPLALDQQWCLFRLEKIVPAKLDAETQTQLQAELFQQWLAERVNAMTVKLEVTEWLYL